MINFHVQLTYLRDFSEENSTRRFVHIIAEMKIFITVAIVQLFLLATGGDQMVEPKRIACLYYGLQATEGFGPLYPKDINASICTHLVYIPLENYTTGEIYLMPNNSSLSSGGENIVPELVQLKSVNPDLKLILHITVPHLMWDYLRSSNKSDLVQNATNWLRDNGFDGVDIPMPSVSPKVEDMVEMICELKTEFDKYGFIVKMTLEEIEADDFPQPKDGNEDIISKMSRCCDYITLRKTIYNETVIHRLTPLRLIKSNVDSYSERGLPLDKILISILTPGNIFTLADSKDMSEGAKITRAGQDDADLGSHMYYRELMSKMNDSSLGWTYRREEETKEPYAFTTTGLWASYEDRTSMEFKARYVMEKGLGGIEIENLDTDDDGRTGDGRFPLTRATHDTFAAGLQTSVTTL